MSNADSRSEIAEVGEILPPAVDYRGLQRVSRVPASVVSLRDLRRLYDELDQKTAEALELHLSSIEQPPDMTDGEFEEVLEDVRGRSGLTVIVAGAHGEQVVSSSRSPLEDESVPEVVTGISFQSAFAVQQHNITPLNRFTLNLDFTEPPSFVSYNPWSQPTPNSSTLEVVGDDHTWVTAVFESARDFFRRRGRQREWIHSEITFNVLNWVVGFPASFWVVYRLDSSLGAALSSLHTALRGALYIYVFLLALMSFRAMVWGLRWIFPLIELEGRRSGRVRGLIGSALASLVLALLYDVLVTLF
jgi:hypothetical protein